MLLKRLSRFKSLTSSDVSYFKTLMPTEAAVITDKERLVSYNQDWTRKMTGNASVVLRPQTTEEVSHILNYCNQESIAVVPQGGNTSLAGGSVPVFDEVILSTERMDRITGFDASSGILTCQSGCVLETLDNWLSERGHMMPLDLGAKGSCNIGGNVATNAGGLRLLRYGSLHGTVLSLEVVLADGTILDLGRPLRKDNTGYDLKHLFIGSEGTLGVVSSVSILTPQRPNAVNVAILGLQSFQDLQRLFSRAKQQLGETLSAFEFWDSSSMKLVSRFSRSQSPFESQVAFYALVETSGAHKEHDDEKLQQFLESALTDTVVVDGAVAQDTTQQQAFWAIRESVPEACAREGGNFKFDVSVPLDSMYSVVERLRDRLTQLRLNDSKEQEHVKTIAAFGHMGDGNLHLNITSTGCTERLQNTIEPYVYQLVKEYAGSVSAEHGMGLVKTPYLSYSKPEATIAMMRRVKSLFDPRGILNPYKYLPITK